MITRLIGGVFLACWIALPILAGAQTIHRVAVSATDIVYDPFTGLILATDGKHLVTINPSTYHVSRRLTFPCSAGQLALSSDGRIVYVSLDSVGEIAQVQLPTYSVDTLFQDTATVGVPLKVYDMLVAPSNPDTLILSLGDSTQSYSEQIKVFDNGVQRGATVNAGNNSDHMAFDGATNTLYTIGEGQPLDVFALTGAGLVQDGQGPTLDDGPLCLDGSGHLVDDTGWYINESNLLNAGTLRHGNGFLEHYFDSFGTLVVSGGTRVLKLRDTGTQVPSALLDSFDPTTFEPTGSLTIQDAELGSTFYTPKSDDLISCGSNVVSFRCPDYVVVVTGLDLPGLRGLSTDSDTYTLGSLVQGTVSLSKPAWTAGVPVTVGLEDFGSTYYSLQVVVPAGQSSTRFSFYPPSRVVPYSYNLFAQLGEQTLHQTVNFTATPVGQFYPSNVSMLSLCVNGLASKRASGALFATVPSGESGFGNKLVRLDPSSASVSESEFVGSGPDRIALSHDGSILFVGVDGESSVAQVDLSRKTPMSKFYIGISAPTNLPLVAASLAPVYGSSTSIVIARADMFNPMFGPVLATLYTNGQPIANADDSDIFALSPGGRDGNIFSFSLGPTTQIGVYSASSSAFTLKQTFTTPTLLFESIFDSGLLYDASGVVFDPYTQTVAGMFSIPQPPQLYTSCVWPDVARNRVFFVTNATVAGSATTNATLWVFDASDRNLIATYTIPGVLDNIYGLTEYQPDHLAFYTDDGQVFFVNAAPAVPIGVVATMEQPIGGANVMAAVALSNVTPNQGLTLRLTSSDPGIATVPPTISLGQAVSTGTFLVGTSPVSTATNVTITITAPTGAVSTVITVRPPR